MNAVRQREKSTHTCVLAVLLLWLCSSHLIQAQTFGGVLTGQYDNNRSGANLQETILTPSNVSAGAFGLLFTQTVDANIFAQPLYVPNLSINGGVHNVAFVATLNNSVYAFDADSLQPALWHTSLGHPVEIGYGSIPSMGILSTPVIDTNSNTIFVVALSTTGTVQSFNLYALNLLTGNVKAHAIIQGATAGTGDNTQSTPCVAWNGASISPPCISFVPSEQMQRTALLEDPGSATVYFGFGTRRGTEALNPYHGWLFGYRYAASTLAQTLIFTTTQNTTQTGPACSGTEPPTNQCGHGAGIWMSGRGPAMDSTGIYAVTGNGGYGGTGTGNWGESALRVSSAGVVEDSFTPSNYMYLNGADLDLSDAGAILFTSTNTAAQDLMVAAGKTGMVYVLNRANLGGLSSGNKGAIQSFTGTSAGCGTGPGQSGCYEIHSLAYWARTSGNPVLYFWAWGDSLRVWDFHLSTNQFALDANQGAMSLPNFPGGGLSISANGDDNGILWAIVPVTPLAGAEQGALYAFNATNVTTPLWTSTDYWFATKFTSPTIADGKVYVPSSVSPPSATTPYSPQLRVYGLCSSCSGEDRRLPANASAAKSPAQFGGPASATTGFGEVSTPHGPLKSNAKFYVR
jgi:hypothetical protein